MPFLCDPAEIKSTHVTCQIHLFCCLTLSLEKSKLPSMLLEKHQQSMIDRMVLSSYFNQFSEGLAVMMGTGWSPCTRRQGMMWSWKYWEHLAARSPSKESVVWGDTQWTRSLPERAGKGECGGQSTRHCEVWKWVLQPLRQILLGCFLDNRCYNRCTSSFSVIICVVSIYSLNSRSGKLVLQLAYVYDNG